MPTPPPPLIGHRQAEHALQRGWQSGRLHHAWLLTGARGIGKASLAHRFAEHVLGGPSGTGARRAASNTHADLLVVTRATDEKRQRLRTEIVLDDVRPISGLLHRTAAEGGWRVVIIDDAEQLNRNAANALLKLLEEPPSRVLILLICCATGRLLPTIRSRCRRLQLSPLDDQAMHEAMRLLLPALSEEERQTLISLSHGSPGRAMALAEEDGIALSALVRDALSPHQAGADLWSYELADAVLRYENGFSSFLGLLSAGISTSVRKAARTADHTTDDPLLAALPASRWAEICVDLIRLRDETESLNLDKRQAVLAGLSLLSG